MRSGQPVDIRVTIPGATGSFFDFFPIGRNRVGLYLGIMVDAPVLFFQKLRDTMSVRREGQEH